MTDQKWIRRQLEDWGGAGIQALLRLLASQCAAEPDSGSEAPKAAQIGKRDCQRRLESLPERGGRG